MLNEKLIGNKLKLRHIEAFRAVMLSGSIKGAAASMNISEPATSKLLAAAERSSGIRLFARVHGRLIPTPEAHQLRSEVDVLWDQLERINKLSDELSEPSQGAVAVNVSPSLGTVLAPAATVRLLDRAPGAKIRMDLVVPSQLLQTLRDGSADVGISLGPHEHPDIVTVGRFDCEVVCALPPDHKLAGRLSLGPQDLVGERVISFPQAALYGLSDAALYGSYAAQIVRRVELRSGQGACWFSKAGGGIAIVDAAVVAGGAFQGLAIRRYERDVKMTVKVMHHKLRPMSNTAIAFCDCFEESWRALMLESFA